MALQLENVIPVGRRLVEYEGMFNLTQEDLEANKIIDCGGGPSSFNKEASTRGASVTSIDPLYAFTKAQIKNRIDETFDPMMAQVKENEFMFVWKHIQNYDELYSYRQTAMNMYLDDYDKGLAENRYQHQCLPNVDLLDQSYDLALCSHLLFLYSDQLDQTFHYESVLEMARIAKEVRIFPIIDLNGEVSPHLQPVMTRLNEKGYKTEIIDVNYEFLKGANAYLRIV